MLETIEQLARRLAEMKARIHADEQRETRKREIEAQLARNHQIWQRETQKDWRSPQPQDTRYKAEREQRCRAALALGE